MKLCNQYQLMDVEWTLIFSSSNEYDDFLGNRELNFKLISDEQLKDMKKERTNKFISLVASALIAILGFILVVISFSKKRKKWISLIIGLVMLTVSIGYTIYQISFL